MGYENFEKIIFDGLRRCLSSTGYGDAVSDFVEGAFELFVGAQKFCVFLDFLYEFFCAVIVGKRKVIYHAMKRKIITDDDSFWGKVSLIFFKEFYVLGFCGIYENQIKKSFERAGKGICVNCSYAV